MKNRKMRIGMRVPVMLVLILLAVSIAPAQGQDSDEGLDVWLTVTNRLDEDRMEPVTSGVPIPQSANLVDLSTLRLLDVDGNPIPAQFTPTARWGGGPFEPDKPVRWLLLDFQINVAAGESVQVHLVDSGGDIAPFPTLEVRDDPDVFTIEIGETRFTLDKSSGGLWSNEFSSAQAPLTGQLTDASGTIYRPVNVTTFLALQNDPMRISIKVEGQYGLDENTPLLDFTTQYWFYAGQSLVRIFHTVENNSLCPLAEYEQLDCYEIDSGGSVVFDDLSLTMRVAGIWNRTLQFGEHSASLDGDLVIYQDSSGTDHWDHYRTLTDWDGNPLDTNPRMQSNVSFRGYQVRMDNAVIAQGDQAVDALNMTAEGFSWGIGVRDLWQNFPKALRAAPSGSLEVGLFPGEFGGNHAFWLRASEHKTHEIWLNVSGHVPTQLDPLFAMASPEWYVNSGAFGMTALPNATDWPDHESYIANQLDTAPTYEDWMDWPPTLFASIEGADFYGIYDYGDWPIDYEGFGVSPLNVKYDNDFGAWIQWARGGDWRWFELAEALDRHIADIDILHNLHMPRHWGDGIIFGHSYHDEEGFINPHRNYGGASPDTAYGMHGMLLNYYLTGYAKSFWSAMELADAIAYRAGNDYNLCGYFPAGQCNEMGWALFEGMYDAGCRPAANSLSILVAAYRATGNQRYLEIADALVDWARPESQPYINGPTGNEAQVRPWMINMYLRQLAYYIEMRQEFGLPDTFGATQSYLGYADWLREYAWIDLEPIDSGARAAYPYEWWFDDRQGDINDEWAIGNNIPSVNNWLLLGADAMAYAFHLSQDTSYLDAAETLFRTGSRNPFFVGDFLTYTATKETANSITFGNIFLHEWANR